MVRMLAHATQPDGQYVMIGDTSDRSAWPVAGSVAEFAATGGTGGQRPSSEIASFRAGYIFGRTGWGDSRPFSDEAAFSLRFGGPRQFHGHRDAGAVTLYGHSSRLVLDPGIFTYEDDSAFKDYMRSHAAHNVVSVAGLTARGSAVSPLRRQRTDATTVEALVDVRVYEGVSYRRRVVFSRHLGYLVVEDRLSSSRQRTYRQLWHLRENSAPVTKGARTWTRRKGGDVLVWQLLAAPQPRIIKGRTDPVQGWVSYEYGSPIPAPVIQTSKSGRSARFITLIAPFVGGAPPVDIKQLSITSSGFRVVVDIDGRRERVMANGSGAWIERLP
jgi:hypothetical protein